MKYLAWTIVILGWVIYGLTLIVPFIDPHPRDPIEDFQRMFRPRDLTTEDFILIPILILGCILWASCWAYIKEQRETKRKTKTKTKHDTRTVSSKPD